MEQRSRRASARWLRAVPLLIGAAGGAAAMAGDLVLLAAGLATAVLLWRAGSGLRGWRLLAAAVGAGLAVRAAEVLVPGWPGAELLRLPGQLVPLPAAVLGLLGVLSLPGRRQVWAGGPRLLTETALFCCGSLVLVQLLVVVPGSRAASTATSRALVEVGGVLTAAALAAVLVLVTVSSGARRAGSVLLLLSTLTWVGAHALLAAGEALAPFDAASAVASAGLLLLCAAARRDRGPEADLPARPGGMSIAGPLLPHLVLIAAATAHVLAPAVGVDPSPTAGAALLACLALTVVHRAVAGRDEAAAAGSLRRSEAHFRSLVRSSSDAVLVLDDDLRISWAAPGLHRPQDGPALAGRLLTDVVHPEDGGEVRAWLTGAAPSGLCSFRLPDGPGEWRVMEAGVSDLRDDAAVRALVLHCRDVTARTSREHQLSSLAFLDPLTGLPNRAAQRVAMSAALAELDTPDGAAAGVSLLLVEVHGLAEARERVGRDAADVALVEVARRLRGTVRTEDQVARIGTELFSVLASGAGDEPDRLAARCLAVIEAPIATEAGIVDLSAAVGLVPLAAGLAERTAVDRAELALIDARSAGPGSVRRHRAELTAARDRRERLRRDLVGARERGELGLAWQPIVSLADSQVTGVEALLRWHHPELGDVPPEEFLPVAECAGLVVDLQRWALREATAAAVTLPAHGPQLKLGVNVSGQHLAAGTLVGDVAAALRDSGLAPERLVIEVPESALQAGCAPDDVTALRLMGVRVALDDFGSGPSSLPQLGRSPLDIIKLDRTLLSRVDRDPVARAVCSAVAALGAALRIDVVAQGVETSSQLAELQAIGCGFAQGFLLSRPVGLAGLVVLLDADAGRLWPGATRPGATRPVSAP